MNEHLVLKSICGLQPSYLGEVQPIQRMALLFHPLHSPCHFLHPLRLLSQVEVQDWHSSRTDVCLGQGVDHQHHPDGPFALPVSSNGIEEVIGVETFAPLIWGHPVREHQLDILKVALETVVKLLRKHILQVLPMRQQLTASQA